MKKRSLLFAGIAILLLLAAWLAWRTGGASQSSPPSVAGSSPPPRPAPAPAVTEVVPTAGSTVPAPPALPPPTAVPSLATAPPPAPGAAFTPALSTRKATPMDRAAAVVELEKVRQMIASYHTLMGQNPVGTNAEIMKALMGGNPRQAMLGPPLGQSLNARGELIDPWGTPYFFHQLSGNDMEIHSAGPDKIMGTPDDLVTH